MTLLADITLTVGESKAIDIQMSTCGGAVEVFDSFTWSSDSVAIATASGFTGMASMSHMGIVTSKAPGVTVIHAKGAKVTSLQFTVTVE